jgi:hypothetical protein
MSSITTKVAQGFGPAKVAQGSGVPFFKRRFLIARRFQLRVAAGLGLTTAALGAVYAGVLDLMLDAARGSVPDAASLRAEFERQDLYMFGLLGALALLAAVGLGLWSILATYRVVGPLYVMTRQLGVLAEGRYPQLRPLRQGDEFQEFYELLHRVVSVLKAREVDEALRLDQAVQALQALPGASEGRGKAALETLRGMRDRKRQSTQSVGSLAAGTPRSSAPPVAVSQAPAAPLQIRTGQAGPTAA